ncbi:MAG TPA: hypothetical protein VEK79_14120 [Thermoanaerobaculia bacterium]|nr:hypothetical protein [Thermoanaerobaculia bacterium]
MLLRESFDGGHLESRWSIGVLATPVETFDSSIGTQQSGGVFTITPIAQKPSAHFSGYVSNKSFDLTGTIISVELRHAARGATTIVAAAIDSENWVGFRIEGGKLSLESHTSGRRAARELSYSRSEHRFLRLRTSSVAPVVVWETSVDGTNWNPEYVETPSIKVDALRIALSAGTIKPVASTGSASFNGVTVELKR